MELIPSEVHTVFPSARQASPFSFLSHDGWMRHHIKIL